MTTTANARYNIIDRRDGEVLGYVLGGIAAARKAVREYQNEGRTIGYRAA